jgi:hypothetical protein
VGCGFHDAMAFAKPTFGLVGPNVSFCQCKDLIILSNKGFVEGSEFQRFVYWKRKEERKVHVNGGRGRGLMKMRHAAIASTWRLTNVTGAANHVKVKSS